MSNTWWRNTNELVREQLDLLDVDPDSSVLISGPPGSGKTNLLLLRANQLFLGDHPNLYVVVFGSLLRNFIQLGSSQYKFPADKVVTHTNFFKQILRLEGADFDDQGMPLNEARQERANRVEELITSKRIAAQFDALLLDEAQDYTSQEIRILAQLTDVLVATADTRQKIYDVDDCSQVLADSVDVTHKLTFHFRNGREICRLADGVNKGYPGYEPMLPSSNYDEANYPSVAVPKHGLTLDEQIDAMITQIRDQRIAYPEDLIGVMAPRNEELDVIEAEFERAGLGHLVTRANTFDRYDSSRPIWLSTLTAAKGLEFRTVHILGLDYLHRMRSVQKRLIFTGITRAKTALTLYWHEKVPGYLESACRPLDETRDNVDHRRIFGK